MMNQLISFFYGIFYAWDSLFIFCIPLIMLTSVVPVLFSRFSISRISSVCVLYCFYFKIHFIRYFLHLNFKCYPQSPLYPPPTMLPNPPTPDSWPWHSPVLGHMIFARPRASPPIDGWLGHPLLHMQLVTQLCGGGWWYWLIHTVDPPIGFQTPLDIWLLSLAPSLWALCSIQYMTVSIHFCICQALAQPHTRQLHQGPVSKVLLAYTIVSGFSGCIWDGSPGGAVYGWSFILSQLGTLSL